MIAQTDEGHDGVITARVYLRCTGRSVYISQLRFSFQLHALT